MDSATPLPTPAHRAALTLHALSGPDRQWVLAGLSPEQQQTLRRLLQELEQLGIPRDAELVAALAPQPDGDEGAGALHDLDAAGVHRLAEVLSVEPARLAAALLAGRAWPWREQLLSLLPPALGREVERRARGMPAASVLHDAVVAELAPVLRGGAANTARSSPWQAMRRRFAAWRGGR